MPAYLFQIMDGQTLNHGECQIQIRVMNSILRFQTQNAEFVTTFNANFTSNNEFLYIQNNHTNFIIRLASTNICEKVFDVIMENQIPPPNVAVP